MSVTGAAARVASSVGKGLLSGAVGTAAMTVSSTVEMKVRGRAASDAPARAAAKILGVEPRDDAAKARFSNFVHWAYGTGWGAARGVVAAAGLRGVPAWAAFFGSVWGSELAMLPSLGVAPPATQWGAREVAIDAWHHAVYATATSLAYEALDAR